MDVRLRAVYDALAREPEVAERADERIGARLGARPNDVARLVEMLFKRGLVRLIRHDDRWCYERMDARA
jgi:hypothetical protein